MKAMATILACILALMAAAPMVPAQTMDDESEEDVPCDPYPIGRCGDYQRESVIFCYVLENGLHVSATDEDAIGLVNDIVHDEDSEDTGYPFLDEPILYLRTTPTEDFIEDPLGAPLPSGTFYEETNFVEGLQPEPFWCGVWVWFAECIPQQWMGPTGVISMQPDERIA